MRVVSDEAKSLHDIRLPVALIFLGGATPSLMIWFFSALSQAILVN